MIKRIILNKKRLTLVDADKYIFTDKNQIKSDTAIMS